MQITGLIPPRNGGTLYDGMAISTRGRRYQFGADGRGDVYCAFREDATCSLPDGRTFWFTIIPPHVLSIAARNAIRRQTRVARTA
jgi:hypothetical protein